MNEQYWQRLCYSGWRQTFNVELAGLCCYVSQLVEHTANVEVASSVECSYWRIYYRDRKKIERFILLDGRAGPQIV